MIFLYAIEGARGFLFFSDPMSEKFRKQSVQYNVPSHPERMWQNLLPAVRDLKSVESFILGKGGPTRLSLTKQKGKCAAALFENDRGKRAVLIVAVSGKEIPRGYWKLRITNWNLARLLGDTLALIVLGIFCFVNRKGLPQTSEELAARFQPVMLKHPVNRFPAPRGQF